MLGGTPAFIAYNSITLCVIAAAEPDKPRGTVMSQERSSAWRRFKRHIKNGNGMGTKGAWKPEKNWKMVYLRSEKLRRAKQLGFQYPTLTARQLLDVELLQE